MSEAKKPKEAPPTEQLAAFAARLAKDGLPRAVIVRGEERYFRERALLLALEAARAQGLEIARHDAQDPSFDVRNLCEDLSAPPMFASARCVFVRSASSIGKRDEGSQPAFVRAATSFLADKGREGLLLVDGEGLRADHALVKAANAVKGVVLGLRRLYLEPPWDPDPRRSELVHWIVAEARTRGTQLTSDDAVYLAAAIGNDLVRLSETLGRVAARGTKSVREVVGWSNGGSPFELAEELCRGELPKAVANIEGLFRAGFQEKGGGREVEREAIVAVLFGVLRGKLRQTVAAAAITARGGSLEAAADAANVPKWPKAREELATRLAARPPQAWSAMLDDLARLERLVRTGGVVDANELTRFALRWRASGRPAARRA